MIKNKYKDDKSFSKAKKKTSDEDKTKPITVNPFLPNNILCLQQMIGNQAVGNILQAKKSSIQNKNSQKKKEETIKNKVQDFSGQDLAEVEIHYNSENPGKIGANAYAKGKDIFLGPGKEKHLAHELWHVVQQKEGKVKATREINGLKINDSPILEKEADNKSQEALLSETKRQKQSVATPDGDTIQGDWKLAPNRYLKTRLDDSSLGHKYGGDIDSGLTSLHHHISKHKLESMAYEIDKANASDDADLSRRAHKVIIEINRIIAELYGKVGRRIGRIPPMNTISTDRKLANLPFNLHYGPSRETNNPWDAFDATTIPEGNAGARREDEISRKLRELEEYYDEAALEPNRDEDAFILNEERLKRIRKMLLDIESTWKAQRNLGVNPRPYIETSEEQWIGYQDVWLKKGLTTFHDFDYGSEQFRFHYPKLTEESIDEAFHADYQVQIDEDDVVNIRFFYTKKQLTHFLNRHTYEYFDFNDIKPMNTFWPQGTEASDIQRYAQDLFNKVFPRIEMEYQNGKDDINTIIPGEKLKMTIGNTYFCLRVAEDEDVIFADEDDNDYDILLELTMIAPSGLHFDAYLPEVLDRIRAGVKNY